MCSGALQEDWSFKAQLPGMFSLLWSVVLWRWFNLDALLLQMRAMSLLPGLIPLTEAKCSADLLIFLIHLSVH